MSTFSEMFDLDKRIKKLLAEYMVQERVKIEKLIDQKIVGTQNLADDVYTVIRDVEMFKYRLVEIETKLSNLARFCKGEYGKEGE